MTPLQKKSVMSTLDEAETEGSSLISIRLSLGWEYSQDADVKNALELKMQMFALTPLEKS